MHRHSLAALIVAALSAIAGPAAGQPNSRPANDAAARSLAPITSQRLERFADEDEFRQYLRDLRDIAEARGLWWARRVQRIPSPNLSAPPTPIPVAVDPPPAPPPPPMMNPYAIVDSITSNDIGAFPDMSANESIVVSGVRASIVGDGEESITNVQTRGVDEGDIVKRIGHFLIVLQDARLFVVDTNPDGEAGLVMTDRINVYRQTGSHVWYDEMLVYGNRILVTGYSYSHGGSELSVFSLGDDGKLTRESVYYISSNDYYDIENYATRLVDDQLVIYTPLNLRRVDPDLAMQWPVIRRWVSGEPGDAELTDGVPIFDAEDIYKPIQQTDAPYVHSISTCALGSLQAGDELECTARAFVGPPQREFYISTDAAYLWLTEPANARVDYCDANSRTRFHAAPGATLFRAPLNGAGPGAVHVRGAPRDQLSFSSNDNAFQALLVWSEGRCGPKNYQRISLKYLSVPFSEFSAQPHEIARDNFFDVPGLDAGMFENRFTEDYVVYGARAGWSSYPPQGQTVTGEVVAVPLDNPTRAVAFEAPHNIIRVERVGANAFLAGYRDDSGLSMSIVDLSATPRIASTTTLDHRYETEGRSHAFNARIDAEGDGLIGLPTAYAENQSGRYWFRSRASDLSFLHIEDLALTPLGELQSDEAALDPSYRCEVSCVDWYGNTRPIFFAGRIFALAGTELIEGEVEAGAIRQTRRLNMSVPLPQSETP